MFAMVSKYNKDGFKIGEVAKTFDSFDSGFAHMRDNGFSQVSYSLIPFKCEKGDVLGRDGFGKYWLVK